METGKITKVKEDIVNIFFLTQQKIIDKAECRHLLNEVRREGLGLESEISEAEFNKNFSAPPQPAAPKEIPKGNVVNKGQHHEVKVKVPEGQQQIVDATEED